MFKLIFALTGIIFGMVLVLIAPEELKPGKKYFLFLRRILFVGIVVFVSFFLFKTNLILALVFFLVASGLFIFKLRINNPYLEIPSYLLFILPYGLSFPPVYHLSLAVLVFLYGLPSGSLLKLKQQHSTRL